MHETRRFAIALVGIGGCVCIAAGILVTGLAHVTAGPVPGVPTAHAAEMLPRLPMPSWSEETSDLASGAPASRVPSLGSVAAPRTDAVNAAGIVMPDPVVAALIAPVPPLPQAAWLVAKPLEAVSVPLMLSSAPRATGADIVFARHRARERDAVIGAFVTAGTHVGEGFRTVGRTLKHVF